MRYHLVVIRRSHEDKNSAISSAANKQSHEKKNEIFNKQFLLIVNISFFCSWRWWEKNWGLTSTIWRQQSAFGNFRKNWHMGNQVDVPPFKFYFEKNGIENMVQWMPFHNMAQWAPLSDDVILFLKDPDKKQLIGLVCPVKKLDFALALTSVEKGLRWRKLRTLTLSCHWEVDRIQGAHWIREGGHHKRFPRKISTPYNNGWELHNKTSCKAAIEGGNKS